MKSKITFTAFIYKEDMETCIDLFMDSDMEYVIEYAKSQGYDEVVNDITGEVVWSRPGFIRR